MKLSDVVGAAGLAVYAEAALVLFLCVFLAVAVSVVGRRRTGDWARASRMPLSEDAPNAPSPTSPPEVS
jgi:cbb3-type cytochrome oxidase subunit 3